MYKLILLVGRVAALVGVGITGIAVLARLTGRYHVAAFESITLLQGGTAAMVLACLAYLVVLAERPRGDLP